MVAEKKVEAGDLITYRTAAFPIGMYRRRPALPFTEGHHLAPDPRDRRSRSDLSRRGQVETDAGDDAAEPFPIVVPGF